MNNRKCNLRLEVKWKTNIKAKCFDIYGKTKQQVYYFHLVHSWGSTRQKQHSVVVFSQRREQMLPAQRGEPLGLNLKMHEEIFGALVGIRTQDLSFRRRTLYPAELRVQKLFELLVVDLLFVRTLYDKERTSKLLAVLRELDTVTTNLRFVIQLSYECKTFMRH